MRAAVVWHNARPATCSARTQRTARALRIAQTVEEERIKYLRMKPGVGEILLAEGDPELEADEERLIAEFREQLEQGMWAAAPTVDPATGRRDARMVQSYADIPADADRVIFFPRAAGG